MQRSEYSDLLEQGPSLKNNALADVERIITGLCESEPKGVGYSFSLNKFCQIIVSTGGEKYNLSLALKNANLEYLYLSQDIQKKLGEIILNLDKGFQKTAIKEFVEEKDENKLLSDADQSYSLIEREAIAVYTGKYFEVMNAILRDNIDLGLRYEEDMDNGDILSKYFILSVLATSGLNKNIEKGNLEKVDKKIDIKNKKDDDKYDLYRGVDDAYYLGSPGKLTRVGGITSTSKGGLAPTFKRKQVVRMRSDQRQKLITDISGDLEENEVAFSSRAMILRKIEEKKSEGRIDYFVDIVHGVATKDLNNYALDSALIEVYDYFSKFRQDGLYIEYLKIFEKVSHVDSIVKYFSTNSSYKFNEVCDNLKKNDLDIIKIIILFKAIGKSNIDFEKFLASKLKNFISEEHFNSYISIFDKVDYNEAGNVYKTSGESFSAYEENIFSILKMNSILNPEKYHSDDEYSVNIEEFHKELDFSVENTINILKQQYLQGVISVSQAVVEGSLFNEIDGILEEVDNVNPMVILDSFTGSNVYGLDEKSEHILSFSDIQKEQKEKIYRKFVMCIFDEELDDAFEIFEDIIKNPAEQKFDFNVLEELDPSIINLFINNFVMPILQSGQHEKFEVIAVELNKLTDEDDLYSKINKDVENVFYSVSSIERDVLRGSIDYLKTKYSIPEQQKPRPKM